MRYSLKFTSIIAFVSLPFSAVAFNPGDNDPEGAPPHAQTKTIAQSAARKVVRPDSGPWDAPVFLWGVGNVTKLTCLDPTLNISAASAETAAFQPAAGANFDANFFDAFSSAPGAVDCLPNQNWKEIPLENVYNSRKNHV